MVQEARRIVVPAVPCRPDCTASLCHACQVGQLKATYSVHTQPGADPGGNTKDNQVCTSRLHACLQARHAVIFSYSTAVSAMTLEKTATCCRNIKNDAAPAEAALMRVPQLSGAPYCMHTDKRGASSKNAYNCCYGPALTVTHVLAGRLVCAGEAGWAGHGAVWCV
jgi:hypothetical protein